MQKKIASLALATLVAIVSIGCGAPTNTNVSSESASIGYLLPEIFREFGPCQWSFAADYVSLGGRPQQVVLQSSAWEIRGSTIQDTNGDGYYDFTFDQGIPPDGTITISYSDPVSGNTSNDLMNPQWLDGTSSIGRDYLYCPWYTARNNSEGGSIDWPLLGAVPCVIRLSQSRCEVREPMGNMHHFWW